MKLIESLKKLPIDLGQGNYRKTTKGKQIAMELIGPAGGAALDIGCREGDQSRALERMGFTVTSIDVEKRYERCIVMDANRPLPFPDGQFDLIWCSEVIEHLERPDAALREFRRVLKPGGRLIITTPNSFFWLFQLFRLFGIHPARLQHPGHLHFFSLGDIRELFPAGQIYGYFPYMLLKCRIRRLVGPLSPTFVVREIKASKAPG